MVNPTEKDTEAAPAKSETGLPNHTMAWGLFRRRVCPFPTWRALVLVLVCTVALGWFCLASVHPFLSQSTPLTNGVLVVEGWLSDYTMEQAIGHFRASRYSYMFATGGPIEYGAPLCEFKSYAQAGAASLAVLGMDTNKLQAVPAPRVKQDRTYTSALTLKKWLKDHDIAVDRVTVVSQDVHTRRSRLLFALAFGPEVEVGSLAVPPTDYDPERWWQSSQGVRGVISELIAYGYVKLFFRL